MANWYGLGRTNYVRITSDVDAVKAWLDTLTVDVDVYERDGRIALSGYQSDSGDLPTWYEDEDGQENDDFIGDFAQRYLADGEVLVYMVVGNEKARYSTGAAMAINKDGDRVYVNIDDIYDLAAKHFGVERAAITEATY